ncbi:MAG TPA: Rid family detoxifying hydrolase, partial [Plasticicumulans sp.]|nr:Rid family detoxifying hydrolase [Plasticicumulans sp.]
MQIIATSEAPAAIGPYSQGIVVNGLLYTSGQIPLNAAGEFVEGEIDVQTEQVIDNLAAILAAAGAALADVVKTTVFGTDLNDFARLNEIYGQRFG